MRLRHCAIAISFSPSFVMSCRGRASSLKSQVAQASILFISREVSRLSFSNLPILKADVLLSGIAWGKPYALRAIARMINQANGKRRRAAWTAHQRRLKTGRASTYRLAG